MREPVRNETLLLGHPCQRTRLGADGGAESRDYRLAELEAEGEEMSTGYSDKGQNMLQRAVMQHLSLTEWRLARRLPVPAGDMMLSRLVHNGWIEMRGENHLVEIRLTDTGLRSIRSRI
jgi:hypothetical protein